MRRRRAEERARMVIEDDRSRVYRAEATVAEALERRRREMAELDGQDADDEAMARQRELMRQQVRLWPAWKCVLPVRGPSHPGAPTPFAAAGRGPRRGWHGPGGGGVGPRRLAGAPPDMSPGCNSTARRGVDGRRFHPYTDGR